MERRPEARTVKVVCTNISEGKEYVGKPRRRWFDNVANDLYKMCVRGWRKIGRDGYAWKLILKEAGVLLGP